MKQGTILNMNRRLVMSKDLNGSHRLFGGTILSWIDEQAYVEAISLLDSDNVVTRYISEVEFISGAKVGDVVEVRTVFYKTGRTSITLKIEVFNFTTQKVIATANEVVMVNVDKSGLPLMCKQLHLSVNNDAS
ncbi:acyl-CoA thioesterase [Burkholderia ubonensis]|uniref:acyl-CoA thioesterase n=1 Tax=Burkholderia ubonensis TaxID=101571 RepID=UPI0009B37A7A|nr:hotdog domain-containing protein [Burkholderia ubonensis]